MTPEILKCFNIAPPDKISILSGGANNRVFKLEYESNPPLVYKQYFQHPKDPRPRLQSEFAFLEYAWGIGLRNIPQPIEANPSINGAIYSYLSGKPLQPNEISFDLIEQQINFVVTLNQHKKCAAHLTKASEGCFSLHNYLNITESRIDRLKKLQGKTTIEKDLESFYETVLLPKWERLKETTCKAGLHFNIPLEKELEPNDWCLSPSDFGFHNTLMDQGKLVFFDFEYAGWDDPCKMISDLFCQPRIPIPEKYFFPVAEKLSTFSSNPELFLTRLNIVFPIIQMKWCCILLNVFTHVGKKRRIFSHSEELDQKEKQLHLAKEQLKKIRIY